MFVDIYLIGQIHGAQNLQLKKTSQKTYVSKDRSRRENAKNRKKIHCLSSQLSSSMSNNLHEIIVLKKRGNTLAQLGKVKSI